MTHPFSVEWEGENLNVQIEQDRTQYPRTTANQLILCARMNTWDTFLALLEKKTPQETWTTLQRSLTSMDKSTSWKFKEKFARQSTQE